MRVKYTIVFVSDMKRSVSFYGDLLGLPLKFESPAWTEFATDGATVALHASEEPNPDSDDQAHTVAGRCRPGFCVPNLDAFHEKLVGNGVRCVEEPRELFGARIAQYLDPDGLPISVSEETHSP